MLNLQELPVTSLPRWKRKLLRSKKLTKLLALRRSSTHQLHPICAYLSQHAVVPLLLKPASALPDVDPCVLVGDRSVMMRTRPVDVEHPAITLAVLLQATVRGRSELIQVEGGMLHDDMVRIDTDRLPEEYQPGVSLEPSARTMRCFNPLYKPCACSKAVSLMAATAFNYAHWLTEILPKVVLLRQNALSPDVCVLVDAGLHPNILRSLELVLPPGREVLAVPRDQEVCVEELLHVSAPGHIPFEPRLAFQRSHGTFSAPALDDMVRAIKTAIGLTDQDPRDDVIFIKRNSGARNVVNARAVEEFAVRQGWKVVAPEELTFDEQVRVFHQAKMVVGATGAAMVNLLFCRPGTRVGIMMSTHPATPYFYWHNMAVCRGVKVEYILCEPEHLGPNDVHSNFYAPISEMEKVYGGNA